MRVLTPFGMVSKMPNMGRKLKRGLLLPSGTLGGYTFSILGEKPTYSYLNSWVAPVTQDCHVLQRYTPYFREMCLFRMWYGAI